ASAVGIGVSLDEPILDGAVDKSDHAVVAKDEVIGDFPDRRTRRVPMASDGKQKLMLCGSEPDGPCLLVTPAQKLSQASAQLEEVFEVRLIKSHIVGRYRAGRPTRRLLQARRTPQTSSRCSMPWRHHLWRVPAQARTPPRLPGKQRISDNDIVIR